MNFASSSGTSPNSNDKFVRIENELAIMKIQMQHCFPTLLLKKIC